MSMLRKLSALFRVIATYPKSILQRPEAEDLPKEVHEAFDELDGVRAVPRMAAIACRRVLELACKGKLEQPKEKLAERIRQLQGQGLITGEIAEWAKRIKDLLNQSTHDGPAPTPEAAEELIRFTIIFIELLYVYPARVKRLSKIQKDSPPGLKTTSPG